MSIALVLLILRIVLGFYMIGHGTQKLFGWFGGQGFVRTVGMMKSKGFKQPWFWALLGGLGEAGGGFLLLLGFLNPLGAIPIIASMLMAIMKWHWKEGLWGPHGFEYPLLALILSTVLGLA